MEFSNEALTRICIDRYLHRDRAPGMDPLPSLLTRMCNGRDIDCPLADWNYCPFNEQPNMFKPCSKITADDWVAVMKKEQPEAYSQR